MPSLMAAIAFAAPAHGDQDQAGQVLEANRTAASSAGLRAPALRLRYGFVGHGLQGSVEEIDDLRRPAYVVTRRVGGFVEQEGYDGADAWARERSGSVSVQAGGDMRALAVNQAYRSANTWWRGGRGGAALSYLGRRLDVGAPADVIRVTPRGGLPFEAWFDARSHLLTRIDEPRHGQVTVVHMSDYRRVAGAMVAGRIRTGTDDPADDEVQTLIRADFLPSVPSACCAAPPWAATDAALANGVDRVTVPFRIVNSHIYADVLVNGKGPFPFMFDTGGVNILTPATASAAGVGSTGSLSMRGGGAGSVVGGIASVGTLAIGGASFRDQPMRVLPLSDSDVEQAGMIGYETFRRFVTRIDYGRRTIEFIRPSAFDPAGAGTPVPIALYGNLPVARGSYDGIAGDFTIDTGNPGSIFLSSPFVERNALRTRVRGGIRTIAGVGIGGPSYGVVFRGGPLKLGTVTVPRPVALMSSDAAGAMADPSLAGNVGAGILRRFVVTLDYAHSLMYLKPIDPTPPDLDRYDRSGMRIARSSGGTQVTEVVDDGPAAMAGVRKSDLVTSVDGRPAAGLSLDEIKTVLRDQPAGTRVNLVLRRQGEPFEVAVALRDLIAM